MTGIVISHGGALEATKRNMTTWGSWFDSIIWIYPEDDPLPWDGHAVGLSQHEGEHCVARQRTACILAARCESAAVLEYDTILFRRAPDPIPGVMLVSETFTTHEDNWQDLWVSKTYGHSPWILDKEGWKAITEIEIPQEQGYSDRWMAAGVRMLGMEIQGLPHGYSEMTIQSQSGMENARGRMIAGGTAVHGVKDQWVLEGIAPYVC